jgi:serine/threonine protein kinase
MDVSATCPSQADLADFRLGRTSAEAVARLEAHLATCATCRQQLSSIPATDHLAGEPGSQTRPPPPQQTDVGTSPSVASAEVITLTPADGDLVRDGTPANWPTIPEYQIQAELGRGGMGTVYRARHLRLKRLVALKVMMPELASNPTARKRFMREATAMAAVEHDHVVTIYQVGEENGQPYLAMPLLQGETLHTRLRRDRTLPLAEVVRLGRHIAEGLSAAHRAGLVHRDIKPANIWLEGARDEGRGASEGVGVVSSLAPRPASLVPVCVKILDFGLARAADQDTMVSAPGAVVGTPQFMSPEQAMGGELDARSDLFSLGAVLYRMAGGELPSKGKTPLALLMATIEQTPTPLRTLNPDLPSDFCDLVMRLLAKQPAKRPQSAQQVAESLSQMEQAQTTASAPRRADAPRATRHCMRWSLAGASVIAVAVLTIMLLQGGPQSDDIGPPPAPAVAALPARFTNDLGMEFALIPRGKAWLGGGGGKPGEAEVEFKDDFYLGVYEVTQQQWQKVMGNNPSHFSRTGGWRDFVKDIPEADLLRFPVDGVSWSDCLQFLVRLSERLKETDWHYRFPTEAEWEYACRGGPMTDAAESAFDYYWTPPSSNWLPGQANVRPPGNEASPPGPRDGALGRTSTVGSFQKPNKLGLHDMHGNVWEWCSQAKPDHPVQTVIRGGSWNSGDASTCRAVSKAEHGPGFPRPATDGYDDYGLRVARVRKSAPTVPRKLSDVIDLRTAPVLAADEFTDPTKSAFGGGDWANAFQNGLLVVKGRHAPSWGHLDHQFTDFACQIVARTTGDGHNGWGVELFRKSGEQPNIRFCGVQALLNSKGELSVIPTRWTEHEVNNLPSAGPARMAQYKPNDFNSVAVLFGAGRVLEVFVNDEEACAPIELPCAAVPAQLHLASVGGVSEASRLEFKIFRVWSIAK